MRLTKKGLFDEVSEPVEMPFLGAKVKRYLLTVWSSPKAHAARKVQAHLMMAVSAGWSLSKSKATSKAAKGISEGTNSSEARSNAAQSSALSPLLSLKMLSRLSMAKHSMVEVMWK
eukprot:GILI01040865.1.p2 GENE.GILI01040865.1~~GILI01040865.1.p2  ORF type:complete len:127 (+),score=12.67 GILI01040865.1:34-381(+)